MLSRWTRHSLGTPVLNYYMLTLQVNPLAHGSERAQASTGFWKPEARIFKGLLDLNRLKTATSNSHSPLATCISRAWKICPASAAGQPKHWWCSWVKELIQPSRGQELRDHLLGALTPWTLLRPGQTSVAGEEEAGQDIPPSHHCYGEEGLTPSTEGRKEEEPARAGPASGSSLLDWLRARIAASSRQERHQGSTAGPLTQLSSPSDLTWLLAVPALLTSPGFLLWWLASEKSLPKVIRGEFW